MKISKRINGMLVLVAILSCTYWVACSSSTSIADKAADFSLQAAKLAQEFSKDESKSNQKYVGKVLEVVGSVTGINTNADGTTTLVLETNSTSAVHCNFPAEDTPAFSSIKAGEMAKVKGICSGYLMDVMLDECTIINL